MILKTTERCRLYAAMGRGEIIVAKLAVVLALLAQYRPVGIMRLGSGGGGGIVIKSYNLLG